MTINHEIVLYTLNPDGSIPDFLCFDNNSIIGAGASVIENGLPPQDHMMIGITENPVSDPKPDTIISVFKSKEEVKSYFSGITTEGGTMLDFDNPTGPHIPEDINVYTEHMWNAYEKLNGIGVTV